MLTKLLHKLSYDWPLAFGDWLHATLVLAPAKSLNDLTFKRALLLFGTLAIMLMLVVAAAETGMIPLADAIALTPDILAYFDVMSAVLLLAVLARARVILAYAKFVAKTAVSCVCMAATALRRYAARARRTRVRSAMSRKSSDDEPHAIAWACA